MPRFDPADAGDALIISELAKGAFVMAHLVKFELNVDYLFTDAMQDITDNTQTYLANGFLLGIDTISEKASVTSGSLSIQISGQNQAIISDVLNYGHLHRKVTIRRAFLDVNNDVISSIGLFTGRVEDLSIEDSQDDSVLDFGIANHWADFERVAGRQTSTASQERFFAGDKGFEFASQVYKKLEWGKS